MWGTSWYDRPFSMLNIYVISGLEGGKWRDVRRPEWMYFRIWWKRGTTRRRLSSDPEYQKKKNKTKKSTSDSLLLIFVCLSLFINPSILISIFLVHLYFYLTIYKSLSLNLSWSLSPDSQDNAWHQNPTLNQPICCICSREILKWFVSRCCMILYIPIFYTCYILHVCIYYVENTGSRQCFMYDCIWIYYSSE